MKKIYLFAVIAASLAFQACDNQLDIKPKGKTTLNNVTDIELLFNQDWELSQHTANDIDVVAGVCVSLGKNVDAVMANANSLERAYMVYDETLDRGAYCTEDARYNDIYKWANYMNIVIANTPDAKGDAMVKPRLLAEAHIMRAYLHYIAVNIYAGQYDAATAENLGGVAYLDDTSVEYTKEKLTVAQVYEKILADCDDEYISELNDFVKSPARVDKAFGNAVKAKVLFQQKKYAEAIPYINAALSFNDNMEDRSYCAVDFDWTNGEEDLNNIFHISAGLFVHPTMSILSHETLELFEPGDYLKDYADCIDTRGNSYGEGLAYFNCWSCNKNAYGIRTETMHYILGECLIRTGKIREGLAEVDKVRVLHIENPELFVDKFDNEGLTEKQAMKLLQNAKQVECIGEYDTFFDRKRWNSEAAYAETLTRNLGSAGTYSIRPDSPLWIMPFPQTATRYNKTLTQNFK